MVATPRDHLSLEKPATPLERLRHQICRIKPATALPGNCGPPVALGAATIDAALGGGLACPALHEITAERETHLPAATGFTLALAVRSLKKLGRARSATLSGDRTKAVVWITEDLSRAENGRPYGPGIEETGISPERLITIAAGCGRDVLWAMEEALRCRAVGVVIGETRVRDLDPVATRRLSHAAAAAGSLGLLLRSVPDDQPSIAATRWIIGAAPSCEPGGEKSGFGPPRWSVRLMRNRRGQLGAWIVEWNSVEQRFELSTHSQPVAGPAFDRPHRAAVA